VVDAVYDEGDPAVGCELERTAEAGHERFFISGVPWSLLTNEPGIRLGKAADETSEDRFCQNALHSLTVGVTEIAIVLRDEPPIGGQHVQELLADPRLAVTWRSYDEETTAISGRCTRCPHQFFNCGRPRDLKSPVYWM
jgi:hypothetical protein